MTIQELTKLLEQQIELKMIELTDLGKEAKSYQEKADYHYKQMAHIWVTELKDAEFLIRSQNPQLCQLFDSLEKLYNEPAKKSAKAMVGQENDFDLGLTLSSFDESK